MAKLDPVPTCVVSAASEYHVILVPVAVKSGTEEEKQVVWFVVIGAAGTAYISKVTGTEGPSHPFNVSVT